MVDDVGGTGFRMEDGSEDFGKGLWYSLHVFEAGGFLGSWGHDTHCCYFELKYLVIDGADNVSLILWSLAKSVVRATVETEVLLTRFSIDHCEGSGRLEA